MTKNYLPFIVFYFFLLFLFLAFPARASADVGGLVTLINSYRLENGLGKLKEDQKLVNAACWLADDMGKKGYFSHTDSLGRDMATRLAGFGITTSTGENIYYTTSGSGAANSFNGWKNSPGHNSIMLKGNYTRIGVGRSYYNDRWYWVADFASGSVTTLTGQCGVASRPPTAPAKAVLAAPKPTATKPRQVKTVSVKIATTSSPVINLQTLEATPSTELGDQNENDLQEIDREENSLIASLTERNTLFSIFLVLLNGIILILTIGGVASYHFINRVETSPSFPNSDQS